ncbi:MAG: ATP synthase F1 subunit epsilon [Coriobacteriia bacterium]|nr:ATP synthase F1 subunit epsilon [Coriobacteriia bacterium]
MAGFRVNVVTPERQLFSGTAQFLVAPGTEGVFGLLTSHAPIMTALASGELKIECLEDGEVERFALSGGFLDGDGKSVTVLATRAENIKSHDTAELKSRIIDLEAKLQALSPEDTDYAYLKGELVWAELVTKLAQ